VLREDRLKKAALLQYSKLQACTVVAPKALNLKAVAAVPVPESLAMEALVQEEKKRRGVVSVLEAQVTAQQVVTKVVEAMVASASEAMATSLRLCTEELAG
jgi:hypothetical protein